MDIPNVSTDNTSPSTDNTSPSTDNTSPSTDPKKSNKSSSWKKYLFLSFIISIVFIGYYIGVYFKNEKQLQQTIQKSYEKGFINSKKNPNVFYKGNDKWKYTNNDNDIDCLVNWDFYDSDKKTLIKANIPRTTTLDKNKKWCATKSITSPNDRNPAKTTNNTTSNTTTNKNIFYKGNDKWKYTNDDNDIDCLVNWDFYDSDKKTLIKANIPRTITIDKNSKWCATKNATLPTERNISILDKLPISITTEEIYEEIGTAGKVGAITASKRVSKKLLSTTAGRALKAKLLGKLKNNIIAKVGGKMQSKLLSALSKRMTTNLGKRMALKFTTKLAAQAGKTAAKVGIKASTQATRYALLAAKLKPSPIIIFDILSMGLDMGDAGGYERLQTKEDLYKLKSEVDKALKAGFYENAKAQFQEVGEELKEEDFNWPIVIDPVDTESESFDTLINNKITLLLEDPNNNLIKPVFDSIDADLESGKITQEQLENDIDGTLFNSYLEYLDVENISKMVYTELCVSNGGIIYDGDKCTLSEINCNKWPIEKDKDGNLINAYTEFKDGKCVYADSSVREQCDQMGLSYNIRTGICNINENYCKSKAAEWRPNPDINNEYDCIIPIEQSIAEGVFGKTITRGLKQVFDPAQYEGCGFDGPIKVKNKCVTLPNKQTSNGTPIQIYDCLNLESQDFFYNSIDNTVRPMLNYNKCLDLPNGSTESGTKLQLWDCNGTEAQKFLIANPPGGTIDSMISSAFGTPIRSKKNPYKCLQLVNRNTANGTQLELVDCLDSIELTMQTETRFNALKTKYDMNILTNDDRNSIIDMLAIQLLKFNEILGNNTYVAYVGVLQSYGNAKLYQIMTASSGKEFLNRYIENIDINVQNFNLTRNELRDDGLVCNFDRNRPADCPPGYTNKGAYCEKSSGGSRLVDCPTGTVNTGGSCLGSFGRGAGYDYFFRNGMSNCEDDYGKNNCENTGAIAYPKCQYLARQKGYDNPDNWTNDACCMCSPSIRAIDKVGKCNADEFIDSIGGRCYKICPHGGTNMGLTCTLGASNMKCKDYEKNGDLVVGKCAKECPPGYNNTGLTCTRTKNRKIDYSTQKN